MLQQSWVEKIKSIHAPKINLPNPQTDTRAQHEIILLHPVVMCIISKAQGFWVEAADARIGTHPQQSRIVLDYLIYHAIRKPVLLRISKEFALLRIEQAQPRA